MFCTSCGRALELPSIFCNWCGERLVAPKVVVTSVPPPSPPLARESDPTAPVSTASRERWSARVSPLAVGLVGAIVVPASLWLSTNWGAATRASSRMGPITRERTVPVQDPHQPFFSASEAVLSRTIYESRVLDHADPSDAESRVERLRFRLRSSAVDAQTWGTDDRLPDRESWAVPLAEVRRHGDRYLAVLTTRCVIDHRYPTNSIPRRFANLALFSGAGRDEQVFKLTGPELPPSMTAVDNPSRHWFFTSRQHLNGPFGNRYFDLLATSRIDGVEADLPVGDWGSQEGVDLSVLYFPPRDPGVEALRLRGERPDHLAMTNPLEGVRAMMDHRTRLFGDTFTFALVSQECMRAMQDQVAASARTVALYRGLAIAATAFLIAPLLPHALDTIGPELLTAISGRASRYDALVRSGFLGAARQSAWNVARRAVQGETLADASWDELGQLTLTTVTENGRVRRAILAGLQIPRGDRVQAERLLATVRSLLVQPGNQVVTLESEGHPETASVMNPSREFDLSAELLRRGLVALNTGDRATLARQPSLVRAARDAQTDPQTRGRRGRLADPTYAAEIMALAQELLEGV